MNNRDINQDLDIDQNNRDYHFGHNRAALTEGFVYFKEADMSLIQSLRRTCSVC